MGEAWSCVPLREVVKHRSTSIQINDSEMYLRCRVQVNAKGVVLRDRVSGADIKTKTQWVAKRDDFLVAEIDAKVGGYGIVPAELDGAVVSSHYFLFELDATRLLPQWIDLVCRTEAFHEQVAAKGSTNYSAVRPGAVLGYKVPLPPLDEQHRIVAKVGEALVKLEEAQQLAASVSADFDRLLMALARRDKMLEAPRKSMRDIAPLVRRPVTVDLDGSYPELGVRSFGNGTFHKTPLAGADVGTKKLFWINPGDLVFQIVFAWEGAVAIARPEDDGRCGSHRFLTCVCDEKQVLADWLLFFFLTPQGLAALSEASPGGAGRNRTLGIEKLAALQVPVPPLEHQRLISSVMDAKRRHQTEDTFARDADLLRRAILTRAFRGEL